MTGSITNGAYERQEIRFRSGQSDCAAWLYLPEDSAQGAKPAVVLGHGLGATRELGLDDYAARFAAAGMVALVFDYRHFGASGGEPRQLLDIPSQHADWHAAIACARALPQVDAGRVALFGSSFGGGHVIATAARDQQVAAVIAQCPFTDGIASSRALGVASTLKVSLYAAGDLLKQALGRQPLLVPLGGPPHSAALMTAPDVMDGYLALVPEGLDFTNGVAARIAMHISFYRPGKDAAKVQAPLLFCVCERDSVAPAGPTLRYAALAPRGEIIRYPIGHFDIYKGEPFEHAVADQIAFLQRHLG